MAKIISGQAIDIQTVSQMESKVGDYKWSHLEEIDFEAEHLGNWMLCNGQSAAGTAFESITGETNVPNAFVEGTFLRQAKEGRALGTYEADENKSHRHQWKNGHGLGYSSVYSAHAPGGLYSQPYTSYVGGDESRPKNIALNLYVKVGY